MNVNMTEERIDHTAQAVADRLRRAIQDTRALTGEMVARACAAQRLKSPGIIVPRANSAVCIAIGECFTERYA